MKKRILSLFLALVMVVGLVPAFAISTAAATDAVKVEHNGTTTYYANLQKAFDGFAPSNNSYGGKYVVTLLADNEGNLNKVLSYPTETLDITLDLNGHTIKGDGTTVAVVFNLGSNQAKGSTITIKDSSGDNSGKITGGKGGVKLDGTDCTLKFEGGTITENHGAYKGGGIFMGAKSKLVMTGGVITGNSVTGSSSANTGLGGGVFANYADILGGKIYGNAAYGGKGKYTGRGGGLCTDVTRTKGYSTLNITNGVIYGNTAENAGDDVMAQGNGMSGTKFALVIGTENWYIDGWNGTKMSVGSTDRYSETSPVAYTDGGFTGTVNADGSYAGVNNKTLGLKYVAPAEKAPAAPNVNNVRDNAIYAFVCNTKLPDGQFHQPIAVTFDTNYFEAGEPVKNADGEWIAEVTANVKAMWENYTSDIYEFNYPGYAHTSEELPEELTFTLTWDSVAEEWVYGGERFTYDISCEALAPAAPTSSSYVSGSTIKFVCNACDAHEAPTFDSVYASAGEVTENAAGEYFCEITWRVKAYWEEYIVGSMVGHISVDELPETATFTLKWDAENEIWSYDGEADEYKVTCKIVPNAPKSADDFYYGTVPFKFTCTCMDIASRFKKNCSTAGEVYEENGEYFVDITWNLNAFFNWIVDSYGEHELVSELPNEPVVYTAKWNAIRERWSYVASETDVYFITCDIEPAAPAVPNADNVDGDVYAFACYTNTDHQTTGAGFDSNYVESKEPVKNDTGEWTVEVTYKVKAYWNEVMSGIFAADYPEEHAPVQEIPEDLTVTMKWNSETEKWVYDGELVVYDVSCEAKEVAPAAPTSDADFDGNTPFSFDCIDDEYARVSCFYMFNSAYAVAGEVYESQGRYYCDITWNVKEYWENNGKTWWDSGDDCGNDHNPVSELPESVVFTAVWNSETEKWEYQDFTNYDITCVTAPAAPNVNNVRDDTIYAFVCNTKLPDGQFHQPIGVTFDTNYFEAGEPVKNAYGEWIAEVTANVKAMWENYTSDIYEFNYPGYVHTSEELPEELTFTLTWDSVAEEWVYSGERFTYDISCPKVAPELPKDNGSNVTDELITIICDTDAGHTEKTYGWADPAANFVFPKGSTPVWDDALGAWTIGVRIDSIETYYANLRFSEEYNDIQHEIVGEGRIDTTLVWNETTGLWETLTGEPFEVHVTCQDEPESPEKGFMLNKFQIKVVGNVAGEEKVWFSTLDYDTVTIGEVYGNREDGFYADVTVTLENDDVYLAAWIEKHASELPEGTFAYDWSKTENTVTFTLKYTGDTTGELYDGSQYWAADGETVYTAYVAANAPAAPDKYGNNVTPDLIRVICDTDTDHAPINIKWQHQSTKVRDWVSGVVWSDEYDAWIVPIRIDGISNYYVWLNFEKVYNNILHPLVPDAPLPEGTYHMDTYLKWDEDAQLWVTLDEKPIEIHVCCQTTPDLPAKLGSYQIQVNGDLDLDGIYGETKANCDLGIAEFYTTTIPAGGYTFGTVYGNREDGFFVDVTVTLEDGDAYITNWIAKCAPGQDYSYNWDKTAKTVTFTLKYNRSTTGELYGEGPNDWVLSTTGQTFGKIGEAFVMPSKPEAPKQANVTDKLVTIICDSDGNRHTPVTGKWYPQHCRTTSEITWDEATSQWKVDVRIGSLYIMYVDQLEDANGGTIHELVDDITTVYATLVWDPAEKLWVPEEDIELHTTCRTAPIAPEYRLQLDGYQVKVYGDVNGEEKAWTTSIPENGYTLSEVYGSREEGFFVDVTITIAEDDIYQSTWVDNRNPGISYDYDWDKTPTEVKFTLEYNGDLNGTLYGDRHASNTNYDWILPETGKTYGVVAEAYLVLTKPSAPTQDTVTGLVTVICDTDGERHAPVDGKWYPQNCKIMSDITWNDELGAYTVDVRVDSIEWYYVHLALERAYNDTHHELVSSNYVDITLIWDPVEKVWAPEEAIEVHTTCKTAPDAPVFDQLDGYQVNVYGDVNGEEKAWTTSIPEDGYTIGEVYGSRDEGFFVDVTFTIVEDDIYQSTWIEKRNPGYYYDYDWDKTPTEVTFTLEYNGDLNGTLYGDRHASNTNYDWVLETNGKTYGVVAEAYLVQIMESVSIVIYRNGNTTESYKTVSIGEIAKGEVLTLSDYDIADYYENDLGFEFYGWYNDGAWDQYKAGKNPAATETITINGWTNIICMVYDYEEIVVKSVVDSDKDNAEILYTGKVLHGTNLVEWLTANVTVDERTGYTLDKWFSWESDAKIADDATVADDTAIYVTYTANEYTITFNTDGGNEVAPITQFYGKPVSAPANPTKVGHTFTGWVREDGSAFSFDGYTMEAASFTLKATWKANTYSVTLVPNNGKINSGNVTEYTYGIGATLPTDVTRLGYKFLGWYDNPEFKGERVWKITETDIGDKVYFAKWELKTLPIIPSTYDVYVANSIKGGTVSVNKTNVPAGVSVRITVDPNSGFELTRLTVTTTRGQNVVIKQLDETTYKFTMPACDVVVDAAFTATVVVDTTCKGDKNCPMYSFTDLDTDMWYHDGIHYCLDKGLMNGYGNSIFAPDEETTRAMIVTILWRLEGSPKVDYKMTFKDVEAGMWYTDAIRWAASEGIVLGYDEDSFGPDDTITREQLATILYRYEKFHGGGFTGLWMFKLDYADAENVSDWAYEAMCWMTMNKIVQGKNDNVLDPQGGATRAEAATMLYRYCTKEEK